MERCNKSTMPVNAEKYFMTHRGILTHDLGNTASALSFTSTNCAIETTSPPPSKKKKKKKN